MSGKKYDEAKVLAAADKKLDEYLAAITWGGGWDSEKVQAEMPKGIPSIVVDDETKVLPAIESRIGDPKSQEPWTCIWDGYYMAFYAAAFAGLDPEDVDPYVAANDWLPAVRAGLGQVVQLDHLVVGLTRPKSIFDVQGRLHCESGPALSYDGGTKEWHLSGVQVPRDLVETPGQWDFARWDKEKNQEVRRVALARCGSIQILGQRLRKISADDWGDLLEGPADLMADDNGRPSKWVRVKCPSTGRIYINRVSPEVTSAKEGVALNFSVSADRFSVAAHS